MYVKYQDKYKWVTWRTVLVAMGWCDELFCDVTVTRSCRLYTWTCKFCIAYT